MRDKQKETNYSKISREAHKDKEKRGENKQKTPEQRANERKQRRRKIRIKMAIYLATGFLAGSATTKLLNPAVEGVKYDNNKQETVIDLDEIEGELNITGSKEKQFREKLARATITEQSREKAEEKIKTIEKQEDIMDIVEETVKKYWEECYGENVENVIINKDAYNEIYKDVAQNGDKINRYKKQGSHDTTRDTVLTAIIETEEGKIYTEAMTARGEKVYTADEVVEYKEENKLKDMADVMLEGKEFSRAYYQNQLGNTSDQMLKKYKEEFNTKLAESYDKILQRKVFGEQSTQETTLEVDDGRGQ